MTSPEPIRQALMFEAGQERTFHTFVARIAAWWPAESRVPQRRLPDLQVEQWLGGRIVRVDAAGGRHECGIVTSWNPPDSFACISGTAPGPETTEIELRFQRLGPALTRVVMEHRGWERMSTALYDSHTTQAGGWLAVLRRYAAVFETDEGPSATVAHRRTAGDEYRAD